jgi:predicted nicotinamide N-methyase
MNIIIIIDLYFSTSEHNKSYKLIGQIWRKPITLFVGEYNKTEVVIDRL